MILNYIWWLGFSSGDQGNVEYRFIAIYTQNHSDRRMVKHFKVSSMSQIYPKIICIR